MSILIVGSKGNMGRRYGAILNYLDKEWRGVDAEHDRSFIKDAASKSDGVIIATPTDTHAGFVHLLSELGKPILCEKPITKDMGEMERLLSALRASQTNLTMVFQYRELCDQPSIGWSYYNYWNHGRDGLIWDCIQIIALARSAISLQEDSPIWRCRINGRKLEIGDMDRAYIRMMERWLRTPGQDLSEIEAIHQKVDDFSKRAIHDSDQ